MKNIWNVLNMCSSKYFIMLSQHDVLFVDNYSSLITTIEKVSALLQYQVSTKASDLQISFQLWHIL
jgi:hypothetical protein